MMRSDGKRYSDIKGGMERGPKQHDTHLVEKKSTLDDVISYNFITTQPANTIKNAAHLMRENDVRRLPVIDAGTKRLEGLVTGMDILDFLGGGPKYNIIKEDFDGNFLSAINCPVKKIMRASQYIDKYTKFDEIASFMLNKKSSCLPVVEDDDQMKVIGLITERDLLYDNPDYGITVDQVMNLKPISTSKGMMIGDVSKIMVRNQLRRLPVLEEDVLKGMVTVFDVLGYLEKGQYKGVDAEENLSTRVSQIMADQVISVSPKDDLGIVVRLIHESGYGGFPVLDDEKLVGIVTTTDILRSIYG